MAPDCATLTDVRRQMRALVLDGGFGLEHLTLTERPVPEPGPGQVLVKLSHASLNYRDWLMVSGDYNPRLPMPLVVASDGVGRVEAQGNGVRLPLGARVCPLFAPGWLDGDPEPDVFSTTLGGPRDGTLTEYLVADESAVIQLPEYLNDEEAACLPCAALTAYSALVTLGKLQPGQHVLCLGTGGVSLFALQFAKALGAVVTITSGSNDKLARARQLGADETLNYVEHPEWGRRIRDATGGVDQVIEVGGAGTLEQSLRAVRPGGTISLIGVLAGHTGPIRLLPIVMRQLEVQGVFVGHKQSFEKMLQLMERHRIHPAVGARFELSQYAAALEALRSQQHFGKICLKIAN